MKLAEYFSSDREKFLKPTPETGEPTDWLDFCELDLKGGRILVVDAQFVPSEADGLLVSLTPSKITVQGKAINYGGDLRVSRLRVSQIGCSPLLGGEIGKTWTDTAKTGICDFEVFSKAWGSDNDASYKVIEPFFESFDDVGIAVFDAAAGAVMPFVHSGFGDGNFSVFELLDGGKRVGFEIEFIPNGEKYPFGATPYQKQARIDDLEQRAEQGNVEAQFQLGKMYQAGEEVENNLETAAKWFKKAAQNGSPEAALTLGLMYQSGTGVPQDYLRARELYETAVAKGSASALNQLGLIYRHGYGVTVDYETAVKHYREAAERGFDKAQFNLGVHYAKGWGLNQNFEEAAKWYRRAADQGNVNSIFNLGVLYFKGLGVPKDEKEAVKLFGMGAKSGHAMCAYNMGHCYETGCGVEKDLKKAYNFYNRAALEKLAIAQRCCGILAKNGGEGLEKNVLSAVKWLRRASENGDHEAHYELGLLYETGEGVTADKVEACKLYQKAISSGFVIAEGRLNELKSKLNDAERAAVENQGK